MPILCTYLFVNFLVFFYSLSAGSIDNLLPDFFLDIPGVTDQIEPKKVKGEWDL